MYAMEIQGQISPGKLTKHHTKLEGIANCTQCHDLGAKISEKKCLDCHQSLQTRIVQNKGYHVSKDVKGKQCITCHSEHHGQNFEMVRFDKNKFNHTFTGYELTGSHRSVDCAQCHKPSNIKDIGLKLNQGTFLGLDPSCVSCHVDPHQKTLGNDCVKCHNTEQFKPAAGFSHNKTDFPLTGAHVHVDCAKCHKTDTKNGRTFQHFSDVNHKNCHSCHQDPHGGSFGLDCKSCHSTESFSKMKATEAFDHGVTGFVLQGRHRVLDCKKCHDQRSDTKDRYLEFANTDDVTCLTCHQDVHENKFGPNCLSCHGQESFVIKNSLPDFDHRLTGYVLTGKHQAVDCRSCHTQKWMTSALNYAECNNCHQDYHQGEFVHVLQNDCRYCHDTRTFSESSFDIDRHASTKFPLLGSHIATSCVECHKKENDRWTFKNMGKDCVNCHVNIHDTFISPKYMPNNDCTACHNNDSWTSIRFDHQQTNFDLKGRHTKISCASCHFTDKKDVSSQRFVYLDQNCAACHENIHGDQFAENGMTDCKKCHGFEKWDKSYFNHDQTRFKLEGAHLKVACDQCHPIEKKGDVTTTLYKTGKLECNACHQ